MGVPFVSFAAAGKKEIIRPVSVFSRDLLKDTFKIFHSWYSSTHRNCHFCGISEEQIQQLWVPYPELTKRKRGKPLEIDRKMPKETYEETQYLVFCCTGAIVPGPTTKILNMRIYAPVLWK